MKHFILIACLFTCLCSYSQSAWKCEYKDSIVSKPIPDSIIQKMEADFRDKGLPDMMIEAFREKVKTSVPTMIRTKYIKANPDSTLIRAEVSEEGSLRMNSF